MCWARKVDGFVIFSAKGVLSAVSTCLMFGSKLPVDELWVEAQHRTLIPSIAGSGMKDKTLLN
jgi:hypothetical protein